MLILLYLLEVPLPQTFSTVSQIYSVRFFSDVSHYLDEEDIDHYCNDFFTCGPPNSDQCLNGLNDCMKLSEELGVGIKQIKTFLPTTQLPYLVLF